MSSPVPIFGTQDLKDDDGPVIDTLFLETDAPPPIEEAMEPIRIPAPIELPRPTRLFTGTETLNTDSQPIQLVVADADRREFEIVVSTPAGAATAADYLNVASELGPVTNAQQTGSGMGVARIRPGVPWDFDAHTGPIYISRSTALSQQLEVSWRAVSS